MSDIVDEKIVQLDKRVTEVEEIVGGTKRGEPGLAHTTRQLVKDMYDEQHGALIRLQNVEISKIKAEASIQGSKATIHILWVIITSLVALAVALLKK